MSKNYAADLITRPAAYFYALFSNSQIRSLFHRQHCKRIALFLFCFLCNQIPDILHTVIQLRALSCAVVEFILQIFDMIFGNIFL